ncbi:MAG: translesion DNA synthesis-associated protein ImuA [Burkholderiales bacterium]|nr:translesion DNA synthesis-associated protein ImuA [Burkholderiales bacterium]
MSASAGGVAAALASSLDSHSSLNRFIWRADQMSKHHAAVARSGYPRLDQELPDGGWPRSALIELLLQQGGIGEIRLLRPALKEITKERRVALVQPPHLPQAAAWLSWGMQAERLLWIKTARTADALWAAEQILRNGSCGALLLWQNQVRSESLRRLHLAAQNADTAFWMVRPLAAMHEASPAPLRLALKPALRGLHIEIVKRRGAHCDDILTVSFDDAVAAPSNISKINHASVDRRTSTVSVIGGIASALV